MELTNTDIIIEFLEDISPEKGCDDCISKKTGVSPRQQVNQICRVLNSEEVLHRESGSCSLCKSHKLVNGLSAKHEQSQRLVKHEPTVSRVPGLRDIKSKFDINNMRSEIVHICHTLWQKNRSLNNPQIGIQSLIIRLRNDKILPSHQANMMLTLCSLRNLCEYDNLQIGPNEAQVASGAWAIISEWWSQHSS